LRPLHNCFCWRNFGFFESIVLGVLSQAHRELAKARKDDLDEKDIFHTGRMNYAMVSNYKRKQFLRIMEMVEQGEVLEIVVAHKDRLVRFGFEWFEKFCTDHSTSIVVMNADSLSPEEEMTKDLLSIIHCFSSRLYGLRKYKKKIIAMTKEHEMR